MNASVAPKLRRRGKGIGARVPAICFPAPRHSAQASRRAAWRRILRWEYALKGHLECPLLCWELSQHQSRHRTPNDNDTVRWRDVGHTLEPEQSFLRRGAAKKKELTSEEEAELAKLWKTLVKLYHPDRFAHEPENPQDGEHDFLKISLHGRSNPLVKWGK